MDLDARYGAVMRRAKAGKHAACIAAELGTSADTVRAFAHREGIDLPRQRQAMPTRLMTQDAIGIASNIAGGIWGMTADAQRRANWQRARDAARAARQMTEGHDEIIHQTHSGFNTCPHQRTFNVK